MIVIMYCWKGRKSLYRVVEVQGEMWIRPCNATDPDPTPAELFVIPHNWGECYLSVTTGRYRRLTGSEIEHITGMPDEMGEDRLRELI